MRAWLTLRPRIPMPGRGKGSKRSFFLHNYTRLLDTKNNNTVTLHLRFRGSLRVSLKKKTGNSCVLAELFYCFREV